jgi:hypothetical protein
MSWYFLALSNAVQNLTRTQLGSLTKLHPFEKENTKIGLEYW